MSDVWSPLKSLGTAASFTGVMVSVKVSEALSAPSLAVTFRSSAPLKLCGAGEGPRRGIEGKPCRQRIAVVERCRVGQGIAVNVRERVGRHLERPRLVLRRTLVANGGGRTV